MTKQEHPAEPASRLEAPPSDIPQSYNAFPAQIPQPLIDFVKEQAFLGVVVAHLDFPKGGTAWLVCDPLNASKQTIVLQNPPTGPKGERYLPMIAQYDAKTGTRINEIVTTTDEVVEDTSERTTRILES